MTARRQEVRRTMGRGEQQARFQDFRKTNHADRRSRQDMATRSADSVSIKFQHLRRRGGLVVRSRPWDRRAPGPKPDSTEDPSCIGPVACQILAEPSTKNSEGNGRLVVRSRLRGWRTPGSKPVSTCLLTPQHTPELGARALPVSGGVRFWTWKPPAPKPGPYQSLSGPQCLNESEKLMQIKQQVVIEAKVARWQLRGHHLLVFWEA
ncbi:hypothetical protein AVEN_164664-1 [Araneus ventricosus]|uniref:Uncharacterized protein n=1 Tax=Araneus ventricosus TaxID=182803 RepID=A0A4Y2VZ99_ARAVE|nr:hypothetical protein AVEN_164664-1 [Araneus ventricosus]